MRCLRSSVSASCMRAALLSRGETCPLADAIRFLAPSGQGPPPDRRGPRKGGYPNETRTMFGSIPRRPAVGRDRSWGQPDDDALRVRAAAEAGEGAMQLHG